MYIYPDNLKAKATLWLWALRDVGVLAVSGLLSAFAMLRLGWTGPAICTVVYGFLAIQVEGHSVLDFCRRCAVFLFLVPQVYRWRDGRTPLFSHPHQYQRPVPGGGGGQGPEPHGGA